MLAGNEMGVSLGHGEGFVAEHVLKCNYITPPSRQ